MLRLITTVGSKGNGLEQFEGPRHVAALPDGGVCVVDGLNQRLLMLDAEGGYTDSIEGLAAPTGVAVAGDLLYVAESTGAHRVSCRRLSSGTLLSEVGGLGSGDGELHGPQCVVLSGAAAPTPRHATPRHATPRPFRPLLPLPLHATARHHAPPRATTRHHATASPAARRRRAAARRRVGQQPRLRLRAREPTLPAAHRRHARRGRRPGKSSAPGEMDPNLHLHPHLHPHPHPNPDPKPNPIQVGGSAPGEMDEPSDLAVHKGEVFVADTSSSTLKARRPGSGRPGHTHGSRRPRALRAAPLWASVSGSAQCRPGAFPRRRQKQCNRLRPCRWNHRINVYGLEDGAFRRTFGRRGAAAGEFTYPTGIDVADSRVYTTERMGGEANRRVQVLSLDGEPLQELLPARYGRRVARRGGQLHGICVDASGERVWVSDSGMHMVHLLTTAPGAYSPAVLPVG